MGGAVVTVLCAPQLPSSPPPLISHNGVVASPSSSCLMASVSVRGCALREPYPIRGEGPRARAWDPPLLRCRLVALPPALDRRCPSACSAPPSRVRNPSNVLLLLLPPPLTLLFSGAASESAADREGGHGNPLDRPRECAARLRPELVGGWQLPPAGALAVFLKSAWGSIRSTARPPLDWARATVAFCQLNSSFHCLYFAVEFVLTSSLSLDRLVVS